jgi:transposase
LKGLGYKVHLSETCDVGQPDLITQVSTTPATTSDFVMAPVIQEDLAARDLLPGTISSTVAMSWRTCW